MNWKQYLKEKAPYLLFLCFAVGFASMLCAAKVLGLSGLRLLENPELVKEAWDNFHKNQTEPYVSPLPEGLVPDVEQVKEN